MNNLVQLVNFVTWSRSVNAVIKESTLDHIYTDNVSLVNEVTFKDPTFGDHRLIIFNLGYAKQPTEPISLFSNYRTKRRLS